MYLIVLSITSIHLVILLIWIRFNKISLEVKINSNEKEYTNCELPESEIIRFVDIVLYLI